MIAVTAHIVGRVQGVGFRWHTMREANRLGLTGWVRNEPDGSVRVHLEGSERLVDEMVAWLGDGPTASRVDDLVVTETAPEGFGQFGIAK